METVWHNLRKKPKPYEYVLVETYTKRYPYRICLVDEAVFGETLIRHLTSFRNLVKRCLAVAMILESRNGLI